MNERAESCDCSVKLRHERELREAWEQSHEQIHASEREALNVAKADINRRLESMNEMRAQIEAAERRVVAERATFVLRDMYDRDHAGLRDTLNVRIDALNNSSDSRLKELETNRANLDGRIWAVGATVGVIISVLVLAIDFLSKYFMK